jgi:hypothetical protein
MIAAIPVPTIEVQIYLGSKLAITVPATIIFYKILGIHLIWPKINQTYPNKVRVSLA